MTAVNLPQPSKIKVHTMIYVQYQVKNKEDIALQKCKKITF